MRIKFQKGNSVQRRVGQANRSGCKHVLLLLFQPAFLLCLSLHCSSQSPLPAPLELCSRWCNNKQLWWQQHKDPTWTPWQPLLRRKCNKWLRSMSTGWWPLPWHRLQVGPHKAKNTNCYHSHTRTHPHTNIHIGFWSHFSTAGLEHLIISRIHWHSLVPQNSLFLSLSFSLSLSFALGLAHIHSVFFLSFLVLQVSSVSFSIYVSVKVFSGPTANLMTVDESLTYTIPEQRFVCDNPEVSFWPMSPGALIAWH